MTNRSVSCPGCKTVLSVPVNVKSFSCPKCKQPLALPDSPPVAAKPPEVKPKPPATQKVKLKASVVDEQKEATEQAEKAKKAELKRKLAEIQDEDEDYKEEFRELKVYTRRIRTSLTNAYWGIRLYMLAIVLAFVVGVVLVFLPNMAPAITMLLSLSSGCSIILIGVAFGYAIAGPPSTRMYGYIGLPVCIIHLVLVFFEGALGYKFASANALDALDGKEGLLVTNGLVDGRDAYFAFGIGTNLFALSDSPSRLVQEWKVPWLAGFTAIFEFTRMAVLVLLVQLCAEMGKATELGFRSFRTINIFFWTVLLLTVFRTSFTPLFADVERGSMERIIGNSIQGAIFLVGVLIYGLTLMSLANAIDDVKAMCTADRYIAKNTPEIS